MSDYAADVCACALASTNKEEFDKCNAQREEFFTKFDLDVDNSDANKINDIMYDCISEHRKD